MIKRIVERENLNKAYLRVYRNKGSAGIDQIEIKDLKVHLSQKSTEYIKQIESGNYQVSPILGKEIPKRNGKQGY